MRISFSSSTYFFLLVYTFSLFSSNLLDLSCHILQPPSFSLSPSLSLPLSLSLSLSHTHTQFLSLSYTLSLCISSPPIQLEANSLQVTSTLLSYVQTPSRLLSFYFIFPLSLFLFLLLFLSFFLSLSLFTPFLSISLLACSTRIHWATF